MYSNLVVAYLFLGGASGGAFFVMAAWSLAFHRRSDNDERAVAAFRALQGVCYPVACTMLTVGACCLLFDLHLPHRALLLVTRPHFTAITFGAYSILAQGLVGLALMAACTLRTRTGGRTRRALEALCLVTSTCVMGYTGVYLYSQPAVALWHTLWLTALFVASSLSSGLGLVMLLEWLIHSRTRHLHAVRPLQRAHLGCLAVEACCLAAFLASAAANPAAAHSVEALLAPDMLRTAILGVCGFGLVVPAALEAYALAGRRQRSIPLSDAVCLIGSVVLRWVVVACGAH